MRTLLAFCVLLLASAGAQAQHIVRVSPKGLTYDATFVSQTVPSSFQIGVAAQVSITMRNTGTATWVQKDGDVFLGTQEPQDNYYWCIQGNQYGSRSGNRVWLPGDVAPGDTVTFTFYVKPLACGFAATPPFRFRMLSQAHGTFGEETPDPRVTVTTAAAARAPAQCERGQQQHEPAHAAPEGEGEGAEIADAIDERAGCTGGAPGKTGDDQVEQPPADGRLSSPHRMDPVSRDARKRGGRGKRGRGRRNG
jgi:hypothetical protein